MGKYLFPILFVIVLVAPFALRAAIGGGGDDEGGGGGSAERRLVVVSPHNPDIRREFAAAFLDWQTSRYGDLVEIEFRNVGGTGDMVKALADFYGQVKAGNGGTLPPPEEVNAPYDLAWGGGDYEFNVNLEGKFGALQAVEMPADLMAAAYPRGDLAGIDLYDQDEDGTHWFGACLSSFGIVYNPFIYERMGLESPETWADLARPELSELLVLADPSKSGSAAVAYMMVLQRAVADAEEDYFATGATAEGDGYQAALDAGWREGNATLLLMAANARYFTESAGAVPADVSHANAAAGTAIDFYGRVEAETVGDRRIRYVVPPAATAVTPDPIGVCYGTTGQTLEDAKRFIAFLLSPEGQRLWILQAGEPGGPRQRALRRTPIRPDVFGDQSGWTDLNNPFETAGGFNQRSAWMRQFGETRLLWQAAWIEAGDALDAAYAAVLDAPADRRGNAAVGRLAAIPVTWAGCPRDERGRGRIRDGRGAFGVLQRGAGANRPPDAPALCRGRSGGPRALGDPPWHGLPGRV